MSQRLTLARARRRVASTVLGLTLIGTMMGTPAIAAESATQRYLVVFSGTYALDGSYALGGNYALNHSAALEAVRAAGGTVATDLSKQIGVMVVESSSAQFYALLKNYALVEEIGQDWRWQGIPTDVPAGPAPEPVDDPAEALQWDMQQIRTDQAHDVQGGRTEVQVGVLDSGIDGNHVDFKNGTLSNVDCSKGHNSVAFLPDGPGVGIADPCIDNQFHGTHVAGTIAARANGVGVVGVAPNVTLIPVKVCDTSGYCYASAVVDGITYAGDQQFEVINMSFFVDNDVFQESTEFKCSSDPTQRAFRRAVERALQYARSQGVVPVAALGNSDQDLAHPVDDTGQPISNECEVVPAESSGVIGTMSLGSRSEKAGYSNYGTGATDVAAPGGNGTTGDCRRTILSTIPGGLYACIQGTSMASPHAAGVAALIVSQFGSMGSDGDWKIPVTKVESILQSTAVDIGLRGYDECFGNGRIDALRAVTKDTSPAYDATAPACPEYAE
ncbi:MAG: S8 family serine peptidase [Chloroflexi bacterium]|nr:S8 family serine peptidase [Chloroflexota bacterium]